MAPNIKNSKPNGIIDFANWMKRLPATTDSAADFYNKSNASFHGSVYDPATATTYNSTNAIIFPAGPYNELTLQVVGGGTVVVKGCMTGEAADLVACNLVTSADGLIRIQSLYSFISISASGLTVGTSKLYLRIW